MTEHVRPSRLVYVLGVLCTAAIVAAILLVGPPSSQSAGQTARIITAQQGVVQSTVSGSGNLQAASQLDLGFKTSGVVAAIHISEGAHVSEGQLLAELDPESAEVTLEEAKANLQAAEAKLAEEEAAEGEASAVQTNRAAGSSPEAASSAGSGDSTSPSVSAATRAANIASAKAAVRSDELAVRSAEEALAATRLFAPESGTIVSLAGEVGETVTGTGTTRASTQSDSSDGSGSSGTGASSSGASLGGASSSSSAGDSSGSSSSSGEPFAVLSDLSSMELVVGLSESEIGSVRKGQPATVTIEALEGRKLAAHVVSVATLPTSSSGVVSYDVTFHLDQLTGGLKPGMSATAEVVVKQAEGVNVPADAISAGSVTVVHGGKQVRRSVVTGLAGDNSTIILSGLKAGEQIALPIARASTTSSILSRLGSRSTGTLGGAGGGGLFFGGGAGGAAGGGFRGGR